MSLALGCVADDYTGASDLANTLTKAGLRTIQTIGVPEDDRALPEADAVVVALKSRSIPADQAVARSREAEAWLRARGAAHVMFKVCSTFDSTDAGNIGPVMDALRAELQQREAGLHDELAAERMARAVAERAARVAAEAALPDAVSRAPAERAGPATLASKSVPGSQAALPKLPWCTQATCDGSSRLSVM